MSLDTLAIGFGCFNFGYRKPVPYTFNAKLYVDSLKSSLEAIRSLTELQILHPDLSLSANWEITEDPTPLSDGGSFPNLSPLRLAFRLYIPDRVQQSMFKGERLNTQTEHFEVRLRHSFEGTIALVHCVGADSDSEPSHGVRLVREYLEQELASHSTGITFEYIGPTPFHTNAFAAPSNELNETGEIAVTEVPQRGYCDLVIHFDPSNSTADQALDQILDALERELDDYYETYRVRSHMLDRGATLHAKWSALKTLVEPAPPFWHLKARLRIHRETQHLISALYEFQAQDALMRATVTSDHRALRTRGVDLHIESFLRKAQDDLPTFPFDPVLKWAEHIEGGSFKQAEIAAVLVSGLLGGVLGSALTKVLT